MKFINKVLEMVPQNIIIKEEKNTYKVFNEHIIELRKDEIVDGKQSFRQVMEYLAKEDYEQLINGSSINYLKVLNRFRKLNLTVYRTVAETTAEVAIKKLKIEGESQYADLPEDEREAAWYQDWYQSNEFYKLQNKYFDAILNGYAKRNMSFEGTATMINDNKLQSIFPCDQIYICEELKMIFLVDMVPVYGTKTINDIVYGDYQNSPLFNDSVVPIYKKSNLSYKIGLDRKAQTVGYPEMNQEALLKYISKKNNEDHFRTWWYTCGRKYCINPPNSQPMISSLEDTQLSELLKTYVIYPIEYMYLPFISKASDVTHKFLWSQAGGICMYKWDSVYKSTAEELEERLNAVGYITEYLNIDRNDTYNYYSDEVIKEIRNGR